ncbi:MAG: LCP family protein [Pseudonocardia sp.]|nr:LCP family protein [Pseudonocardia sp.]
MTQPVASRWTPPPSSPPPSSAAGRLSVRRRAAVTVKAAVVVASVLVLAVTGYGWSQYRTLTDGIRKSGDLAALAAPPVIGTTTNILVMGLDSRLDENGNPLPPAIYDALNTGGADVGGYNANVLMLLHIPGDGSKATAMSIPRDDYVALAGSPDGTATGKIKQAYGLALDQQHRQLAAQGITDKTTLEQRSRDAGRNAEISTVSQFLGIPIDHFVEVTMVAFYQIAQVVAPITVCVNENTRDSYSGSDFHQGTQQIDAAQAVAFVRQRRDNTHPELNFTDLDRERRQQAFIASLAYQLKQAGTLGDPGKLSALIEVAKQNTAVDPSLNLLSLAQQAAGLTSGNITFTTLPIERFGTDPLGESVNIVDPTHIQAVVAGLLAPPAAPGDSATPPPVPPASLTVDVVNASGRAGLAASVRRTVASDGYTAGTTGNSAHTDASTIGYPPGAAAAAQALAHTLGIATTSPDPTAAPHHLKVVLGATFSLPPATAAGPTTPPSAGAAASTLADSISGGSIPCVK